MKFEAGKYYKTRSGHKAIVYAVYDEVIHGAVFCSEFVSYPSTYFWGPDGKYHMTNMNFTNGKDLVEEWKEPFTFECEVEWDCGSRPKNLPTYPVSSDRNQPDMCVYPIGNHDDWGRLIGKKGILTFRETE